MDERQRGIRGEVCRSSRCCSSIRRESRLVDGALVFKESSNPAHISIIQSRPCSEHTSRRLHHRGAWDCYLIAALVGFRRKPWSNVPLHAEIR
jgi:hypothetical protein